MELQALPFLAVVGFLQHINNQIQILVSHDELGDDELGDDELGGDGGGLGGYS